MRAAPQGATPHLLLLRLPLLCLVLLCNQGRRHLVSAGHICRGLHAAQLAVRNLWAASKECGNGGGWGRGGQGEGVHSMTWQAEGRWVTARTHKPQPTGIHVTPTPTVHIPPTPHLVRTECSCVVQERGAGGGGAGREGRREHIQGWTAPGRSPVTRPANWLGHLRSHPPTGPGARGAPPGSTTTAG